MTSDLADTSRVQENRPLENEKTPESSNEVGSNGKRFGLFKFRPYDDEEEEDWWFASTAIPLIAATLAPLANVLSIAARVASWRMSLIPENKSQWDGKEPLLSDLDGFPYQDPSWMLALNVVSLIFGFVGNLMLLANFTNRIRYIIALPATILSWFISTALVFSPDLQLTAIILSMNIYYPPVRPVGTYTQGFWYGVIAAVLYLFCAMILMVNMLGYFMGHYPQHFNLTEAQRTLILQSILFFVWLAGGAGIFSYVEQTYGNQKWLFTDALYFCDVTILTVGFGDLYPHDDVGRGLVFPFSVGGSIMLGLMIGSLTRFAREIGQEKVVQKRVDNKRIRTIERSHTNPDLDVGAKRNGNVKPSAISFPFNRRRISTSIDDASRQSHGLSEGHARRNTFIGKITPLRQKKRSRALVLDEEKDRFDAMRAIQKSTSDFKHWTALTISVVAFGILWCIGAVVFWRAEAETQDLSYFQALYFCYVSLLTIGYGDLAPKSNAGRPFFVVWSLLAVPTMTILISDMGDTVISNFKKGTSALADFTVLPKQGIWRDFLNYFPTVLNRLQDKADEHKAKKRTHEGFPVGPDEAAMEKEYDLDRMPTLHQLAQEDPRKSEHELARRLAMTIRKTVEDIKDRDRKRYSYDEWVEITELIRFTSKRPGSPVTFEEDEDGIIQWDWIGENSPMMAGKSEPEFVLDRLCESMSRYARSQASKYSAPSGPEPQQVPGTEPRDMHDANQ